jgi:hypothetical protein
MRGIVQVERWGDRRSYAFLCGRPLRDRSQERVGVVMSQEPPANFNIERDIPDVSVHTRSGVLG